MSRPFSLQIPIKPLSNPTEPFDFPLLFNPTPKFLGVTFDRTLSFGAHVQSLCSKFYPRHKALRSIATASWGPQKNLSPYSTKPLSIRCLHMPLLVGSHSFVTLQPITWKFYTELHAGSLLVASFPPPPHYSFSRPQLPPLKLTLEHQTLYSFERALRLPRLLHALAIRNVPCRL